MFRRREVPVYLFSGFLESGKTSFIIETMKEGQFQDGQFTIYINCEEGVEEISEELQKQNRFRTVQIENEEDVTPERLKAIEKEEKPDRVIIEYNGTWDLSKVIEAFPEQWMLAEGIATVDASTYEMYLNNMKMMMLAQFEYADLILFNRCRADMNLAMFKRTAHAKNRRSQVIFEMEDGTMNNDVKEELPYDLNAAEIVIPDEAFGLWYLDAFEHPDHYRGKKVKFKGQVLKPDRSRKDVFVPGRFAMTCCAADIQFVGFPCKYDGTPKLKERAYVEVTAVVQTARDPQYGQEAPVLFAEKVEKSKPTADELVYFT